MKDRGMISIIVPVYNIEQYIERCIVSIISQTYPFIEVIIVDDGSTDNSGKICDRFAKQDKRVKVIHKENGGLSDARNRALEIATGDYVGFVDGDDWIHAQMFELLISALVKNDADISACMYSHEEEDLNRKYESDNIDAEVMTGLEAFMNLDKVLQMACNKLYKKDIFNHVRYPVGRFHEDEYVLLEILSIAKKVVSIEERLYYYTVRDDSIMSKMSDKRIDDMLCAFENRIDYAKTIGKEEIILLSVVQYLNCCINLYNKIKKGVYLNDDSDILKKLWIKENKAVRSNKSINIGKRYKLFAISPTLYYVWCAFCKKDNIL